MSRYLHSRYSFSLTPSVGKDTFTITNRSISGKNCPYLNKLFAHKGDVKVKKLQPTGLGKDYILYPIIYGDKGNETTILLETALFMHPYGIINQPGSPDCMLFIISPDNEIEIFVSEGNANMTAQLLQMLIDGSLLGDMDDLLTNLPD